MEAELAKKLRELADDLEAGKRLVEFIEETFGAVETTTVGATQTWERNGRHKLTIKTVSR